MSLKFDVREEGGCYTLRTVVEGAHIEVRASGGELRRLLVDLVHTLDYKGPVRAPAMDDHAAIEKLDSGIFHSECSLCGYPVEAKTRPDARELLDEHRESVHNQGGNNE